MFPIMSVSMPCPDPDPCYIAGELHKIVASFRLAVSMVNILKRLTLKQWLVLISILAHLPHINAKRGSKLLVLT